MRLVDYLAGTSSIIFTMRGCTDGQHHCAQFAFINRAMQVLDICASDAIRGREAHAVIPLPWSGSQAELEKEVAAQCAAWSRYFGYEC
jgi:hypothetical protein